MDDDFREQFESRVIQSFAECGITSLEGKTVGVAVSGGADSVSLLYSLSSALASVCSVKAVTVNHNLRAKEETEGDALYVQRCCEELGVPCRRYDVEENRISSLARERGTGIEEAARYVRYELFDRFIEEEDISFLCLAHNRNDQVETMLMRVLSGSAVGIPRVRGKIVRPLLSISRADIERYLAVREVSFRTDKTNMDTAMLRNRIRNVLVPSLHELFPGFDGALLSLCRKTAEDEELMAECLSQALPRVGYSCDGGPHATASLLAVEKDAVCRRIIYRAIENAGPSSRVPYAFVCRAMDAVRGRQGKRWREDLCGLSCGVENDVFFVKKKRRTATESGFFVIIEKIGSYRSGPFVFDVEESSHAVSLKEERSGLALVVPGLRFPFAVRSAQSGDEVCDSAGKPRSVASVMSGWKASSCKDRIPVVQRLDVPSQDIVCIWGALAGFDNWIVKDKNE